MSTGLDAWRIDRAEYVRDVRAGTGARLYGGRWNSPGRPAIYCAATLSLAMLEIRVHVSSLEDAAIKRVVFRVSIPADAIEEIPAEELPRGWRSALNVAPCRKIGDAWLKEARTAALVVPSAIVPQEKNVILNPAHPDFRTVRWSRAARIGFDSRLFTGLE